MRLVQVELPERVRTAKLDVLRSGPIARFSEGLRTKAGRQRNATRAFVLIPNESMRERVAYLSPTAIASRHWPKFANSGRGAVIVVQHAAQALAPLDHASTDGDERPSFGADCGNIVPSVNSPFLDSLRHLTTCVPNPGARQANCLSAVLSALGRLSCVFRGLQESRIVSRNPQNRPKMRKIITHGT